MKKLFTLLMFVVPIIAVSQKTIHFRVSTVYSDVDDMDGFGAGASDPQWDYRITDNTFGEQNEDNTELSGTNCPFNRTLNDEFFTVTYDCQVPASYEFRWRGLEDDGIGSDANTGYQFVNIPGASINLNNGTWTTLGTYTATAGGDRCGGGGTVTWRETLQYRVTGTDLCKDECVDPYVIPSPAQFQCQANQTATAQNIIIDARMPGHATDLSFPTTGITCPINGGSPEDIWMRVTIPPNTGGVLIQFENRGGCTGVLCQTNITYAWYTSSDGTCNGLEYRGCDAVTCFFGCNNGEIRVDGRPNEDVWVRVWEEDDQGFQMTVNEIQPTAPADRCYTALPLGPSGCNYQATAPLTGLYPEPDLAIWTSGAHPGGICQDGDRDPLTNRIWTSMENLVWYTFTHPQTMDFNIAIDNMSCIGGAATAQIAVFSNSGTAQNPSCDLGSETGFGCSVGVGQVELNINNLPAGDYLLVVDGNAGAECEWSFLDSINGNPLPIVLANFSGEYVEDLKHNALNWTTSSEINNDFYLIQWSKDGTSWKTIGEVDANGESSSASYYEFKDDNPSPGVNLYRLKQVDLNGEFNTTEVVKIIVPVYELIVYPNPAEEVLFVDLQGLVDIQTDQVDKQSYIILNNMGQTVHQGTMTMGTIHPVDISSFEPGIYFLKAYLGNKSMLKRFVKS